MTLVRHDDLGECFAGRRVEQAAAEVDLERGVQDALRERRRLAVLDVADRRRERQSRRIALSLSGEKRVDAVLQEVFARAARLRAGFGRREQRAARDRKTE